MPALGWAGWHTFREMICAFDHWIALGLLSFIAAKMIIESQRLGNDEGAEGLSASSDAPAHGARDKHRCGRCGHQLRIP